MILDTIIDSRRKDVAKFKETVTIDRLLQKIEKSSYSFYSMKEALTGKKNAINIIAEVKKASPSKGIICETFEPLTIAKAYERGGAAALSVLTEPKFFMGDNSYLSSIKQQVKLPVLRKDFIIDAIQIYEARAIGADCILLIAAALTDKELVEFLKLAESLGLDTLVETHNEEEVKRALAAGAQIIGVNNRDLRDFGVNLESSEKLRALIPRDKIFVSESGIHTKEDVIRLKRAGANALLIGESVVKAGNPEQVLQSFLEE